MFEHFCPDALTAVSLAQEETRRLGHTNLGTEFILLGLIGEGSLQPLFRKYGMTLEAVRLDVEHELGRGTGTKRGEIPLTFECKRWMQRAWQMAHDKGEKGISAELCFSALLAHDDGAIQKILATHNVDVEQMKLDFAAQEAYLARERASEAAPQKPKSFSEKVIAFVSPKQEPTLREEVTNILNCATRLARKSGRGYQGSEHILLALIEEDPITKLVLSELGATSLYVTSMIQQTVESWPQTGNSELPRTAAARRTLEIAKELAVADDCEHVRVMHLFLALLQLDKAIATEIIDSAKIDRKELFEVLSNKN